MRPGDTGRNGRTVALVSGLLLLLSLGLVSVCIRWRTSIRWTWFAPVRRTAHTPLHGLEIAAHPEAVLSISGIAVAGAVMQMVFAQPFRVDTAGTTQFAVVRLLLVNLFAQAQCSGEC